MKNKKFIVIACRHCDRRNPYSDESGLTDKGIKQAENIGKMLILAKDGLLDGVPKHTIPKTCKITNNMQCNQTSYAVYRTIKGKVRFPEESDLPLYEETECRLEICSMGYGSFNETLMGAMAFITVEDGKEINRVFFTPDEIDSIIKKAGI